MSLETFITLAIIPVVGGLAGAIIYLWKEQVKTHKELASQREAEIELLKKEQKRLESDIDNFRDRLHSVEMENAKLEAQFLVLQGSNQSSPLPMWMKDKRGKVLVCNHAYERLFLIPLGKNLEDYLNHTDYDVWPGHIADAFRANDEEVVRTRSVMDAMENVRMADGSDKPFRIIKYPRISGGIVIGVDGIAIPDSVG